MPSKQYHITDRIYFCHESSIYQLPSIMEPVSRIYCPEESRQCNYLSVSSASHRQIYILLLLLSAVATSSAQQQQCCGDVGQNDEYCQNIYARDCSNCYRRININICCSLLTILVLDQLHALTSVTWLHTERRINNPRHSGEMWWKWQRSFSSRFHVYTSKLNNLDESTTANILIKLKCYKQQGFTF